MTRILTIIALLFAAPMLSGCAGTGISSPTLVSSQMAKDGPPRLFFYRQKQGGGAAFALDVELNGKKIGRLGIGEVAIGKIVEGRNRLRVRHLFIGSFEHTFEGGTENRYIMTDFAGGWTAVIDFMELNAEIFAHKVSQGKYSF